MLAKAGYEEAKKTGDNASVAIYHNLAGQTLQAVSGMPPDKVNLTSQAQSVNADPTSRAGNTQTSGVAIEHYEILQAYRDNKVAAETMYQGKRVTIVGPVDFVLIEQGKPVLRMGVPAWSGLQMFCIFPVSQKAAVAPIVPNQRVVMECTVLGEAGGVSKIGRVDLGSSVGRLTLDDCVMR
jgi:hypothetical protein